MPKVVAEDELERFHLIFWEEGRRSKLPLMESTHLESCFKVSAVAVELDQIQKQVTALEISLWDLPWVVEEVVAEGVDASI